MSKAAKFPKQISDSDLKSLILSMAEVRGEKGFTEAEALSLYNQCECHLLMAKYIQIAISGGPVMVDISDDDELVAIHRDRVREKKCPEPANS